MAQAWGRRAQISPQPALAGVRRPITHAKIRSQQPTFATFRESDDLPIVISAFSTTCRSSFLCCENSPLFAPAAHTISVHLQVVTFERAEDKSEKEPAGRANGGFRL
jgi:hypothetical protein